MQHSKANHRIIGYIELEGTYIMVGTHWQYRFTEFFSLTFCKRYACAKSWIDPSFVQKSPTKMWERLSNHLLWRQNSKRQWKDPGRLQDHSSISNSLAKCPGMVSSLVCKRSGIKHLVMEVEMSFGGGMISGVFAPCFCFLYLFYFFFFILFYFTLWPAKTTKGIGKKNWKHNTAKLVMHINVYIHTLYVYAYYTCIYI